MQKKFHYSVTFINDKKLHKPNTHHDFKNLHWRFNEHVQLDKFMPNDTLHLASYLFPAGKFTLFTFKDN